MESAVVAAVVLLSSAAIAAASPKWLVLHSISLVSCFGQFEISLFLFSP